VDCLESDLNSASVLLEILEICLDRCFHIRSHGNQPGYTLCGTRY